MTDRNNDEIRRHVADNYARAAEGEDNPCCTESEAGKSEAEKIAQKAGYSAEELDEDVSEANLGLSCGNPQAIAGLEEGETVIDLGCGAGFDVFLAAKKVGTEGKIIGVDMTPEMINRARETARKNNFKNVEFRLGEIENIPAADETADVIISNCVINLSPDKPRVYSEAYRVLKAGGRLAISDVVKKREFPEEIKADPDNFSSCITGAITADKMRVLLKDAGFKDISIEPHDRSGEIVASWHDDFSVEDYIYSAGISAHKQDQ